MMKSQEISSVEELRDSLGYINSKKVVIVGGRSVSKQIRILLALKLLGTQNLGVTTISGIKPLLKPDHPNFELINIRKSFNYQEPPTDKYGKLLTNSGSKYHK